MKKEEKEVYVVSELYGADVQNQWAFHKYENAVDFYISKVNNYFDHSFSEVQECIDYFSSDEYFDNQYDSIVHIETVYFKDEEENV